MKEQIKKAVLALFPELAGGYHLTKRAKVLRINDLPSQSETCNDLRPRYSCDVVVLNFAGHATKQELFDVPLSYTGLYRLPQPDDIVRIEFDYGNPALPVIAGVLSLNQSLPALQQDQLLIQKDDQTKIKLESGKISIDSSELQTFAKEHTQRVVNLQQHVKTHKKTVSGYDEEDIGGVKNIEAGGITMTSTTGLNMGAISNAQLSSAMELALLGGKKVGIGSKAIEIKTSAAEITISKLGDITIKNKLRIICH